MKSCGGGVVCFSGLPKQQRPQIAAADLLGIGGFFKAGFHNRPEQIECLAWVGDLECAFGGEGAAFEKL